MAKSKKERVAEHMAAGMSRIEAEMAVSREDAKAEMKALRAKAARQEKKINAKIEELIKSQHPQMWDSYRNEAMVSLGLLERVETSQTGESETADAASLTDPEQPAEQAADAHELNGSEHQQEHQHYDPNR